MLGRRIRIERGSIEREAIVVGGRYEFRPLPGALDPSVINVTTDPLDLESSSGGGSGDFQHLLAWLSRHLGRRVLDETDERPGDKLKWYQRESSIDGVRGVNPPQLDSLLALLAAQTSLQFTREHRMVDAWIVRDLGTP